MEKKQCPNCHQQLPIEAHFCPYCMTKLVEENSTEIHPKLKKQKKQWCLILVGAFVLLLVLGSVGASVMVHQKKKNTVEQKTVETENYETYLGVWRDEEHGEGTDLAAYGGKRVEICKVVNDEIVFYLENFSDETKRNAFLEDMKVSLKNGQGSFSFSDDGFGNSGKGTIRLSQGKIHIRVQLDNSTTAGEWDLSMDTDFVQVKRYTPGQEVDVAEMLTSYRGCRALLGNRTDVTKYGDDISYVFDNGITVSLKDVYDMDELYITEMWIDYETLRSDYKITYLGIDNTSTRIDVEQKINDDELIKYEEYYYYRDKHRNTTVMIYFDDDGYVESINYMKN